MASLQFKPVCHSWVALHPEPKGVIQFIGGAFSALLRHPISVVTCFNSSSINPIASLFIRSALALTIAGNPFLLREQYRLAPALIEMAMAKGEDPIFYLESKSHIWLGHSIGCKYIALLESADQLPEDPDQLRQFIAKLLELPREQARNRISVDAKFVSVDFTNIWPPAPQQPPNGGQGLAL